MIDRFHWIRNPHKIQVDAKPTDIHRNLHWNLTADAGMMDSPKPQIICDCTLLSPPGYTCEIRPSCGFFEILHWEITAPIH